MELIEKPWGHEKIWAQTKDYVGKILFIKAGHRLSKQYHEVKEETILVVKGTLCVYDGKDKVTHVYPGENFHVVPGQVHRVPWRAAAILQTNNLSGCRSPIPVQETQRSATKN